MKQGLVLIIILFILSASGFAGTDKATHAAAVRLLNVMGMQSALEQSMEQMLNLQIKQNPTLSPYRAVMLKFFHKHMSYESLKEDLAVIYSQAFTIKELNDITSFYKTSAGQKAIKKMPELMSKGGQIGLTRVQQNLPELQRMIQEETAKIEKSQQ